MTPTELQAIRERWAKAMPGPWKWDVNKSCKFVSLESPRYVAMGFRRYGMNGAQPTFPGEYALEPAEMLAVPRKANHPTFDMDINHPNAVAIASAPTDIRDLLAEVERQAQEIAKKDRMLEFIYRDEYEGGSTFSEWLAWLEKEAEVQG